jgi:predicted dinucleotide-binding enzyme
MGFGAYEISVLVEEEADATLLVDEALPTDDVVEATEDSEVGAVEDKLVEVLEDNALETEVVVVVVEEEEEAGNVVVALLEDRTTGDETKDAGTCASRSVVTELEVTLVSERITGVWRP